jgi:hypothetical protein
MMSIREDSVLSESVRPDLLEEVDNNFLVAIADGGSFNFIEASELSDPYSLDISRYIPNPPITYEGFIDLATQVIENAQERAQIKVAERIKLVKEFNPEQFGEGDEVVTVKLMNRAPAKMSADGTKFKTSTFRPYDQLMDPRYPNKVLEIQSRPLDHKVQFAVWAKTSTLADARALWLERLFIQETWVFKSKGASLFLWEDRSTDTFWQHAGARLQQRILNFKVRLHEYLVVLHPTIKQFKLQISNNINSD